MKGWLLCFFLNAGTGRGSQPSSSSALSKSTALPDSKLNCHVCGKSFDKRAYLKRHQRIHAAGAKPYHCSLCGKSFLASRGLMRHQRVHTVEKPYQCSVCGKRFYHVSNLKQHEHIHTGEKPYACDLCGKDFSRVGHLRRHLRTQHSTAQQTQLETRLQTVWQNSIWLSLKGTLWCKIKIGTFF